MILEIRTYRVQPGRLEEFVGAMRATLPLLAAFGIDVVAAGASLQCDDGEHAYLIRAFPSLAVRASQEAHFYESPSWRDGHRATVVGLLLDYHTVILDVPERTVAQLRSLPAE